MRFAVPIMDMDGLDSDLCGHFGSAPYFAIVDTESGEMTAINNANSDHVHGACSPFQSLMPHNVEAVVVQGIGMNAHAKLAAAGIRIYLSNALTIRDVIIEMQAGSLNELSAEQACRAHGEHRYG